MDSDDHVERKAAAAKDELGAVPGTPRGAEAGVGEGDAFSSADDLEAKRNALSTQPSRRHGFFDPAVAPFRKAYTAILLKTLALSIVLMWAFLPLYWGSLAYSAQHSRQLSAWVVDLDGGPIGQGVLAAVRNVQGKPGQLGWIVVDHSDPDAADAASIQRSILAEKAWLALVVQSGASANLSSARANPGASPWAPQSAITVYYAQGRNEQAAGTFIVPITTALLTQATAQIGANSTAQFIAGANLAQLQTIAQAAPQLLANPIGFSFANLRPYTATVAAAVLLVGQIYTVIFAFIVTMANFGARQIIADRLKLSSYILVRVVAPTLVYLPLSLSFAMISLPFKLTFSAKWNYASGFFAYWTIAYATMLAMGLATEAMITLLTPRFIAFFLLALIIANVSVASLPTDLQAGFYRYGKGFPVYHSGQAIRTIIFNTKSHLGLNYGVLIAWIALSIFTTVLATFVLERMARRKQASGVPQAPVAK